jgi:hypothetical protein
LNVHKDFVSNDLEQNSDTRSVTNWDSELSDLTLSNEEVEEGFKEAQHPQLKIRISSQKWREVTDAPRCCSRCQVQLAPNHRKKQCPNCLRLFRDYRHMKKAGIQVPQGFLNLNLRDAQEDHKKSGVVLSKIGVVVLFNTFIVTVLRRVQQQSLPSPVAPATVSKLHPHDEHFAVQIG